MATEKYSEIMNNNIKRNGRYDILIWPLYIIYNNIIKLHANADYELTFDMTLNVSK